MGALKEIMIPIKSIALKLDHDEAGEVDEGVNRQTALFSLKIIARILANHDSTPFIKVPNILISLHIVSLVEHWLNIISGCSGWLHRNFN